ncbi:MAG: ExbD/TolR family protein [Chitinophagales bacterium]
MARIRSKESKETPAISTASLPDIIFILLFFFMVATVMRNSELLVNVRPAQATELTKLEKKSLVSYIHVGPPSLQYQAKYGTAPKIQLNDVFADKSEIRQYIENERAKVDEKLIGQMTTSLKVDKETKMGIVTDIKQELRKVAALKMNYSAAQRADDL